MSVTTLWWLSRQMLWILNTLLGETRWEYFDSTELPWFQTHSLMHPVIPLGWLTLGETDSGADAGSCNQELLPTWLLLHHPERGCTLHCALLLPNGFLLAGESFKFYSENWCISRHVCTKLFLLHHPPIVLSIFCVVTFCVGLTGIYCPWQ